MPENKSNYGLLIGDDIKIFRQYFQEMAELIGIKFIYKAPKHSKTHDTYGDLNTKYELPVEVWGIMNDHPDQKTLKKMGWVAELQEGSSIIHVPYDLPGLEEGGIFTIPSGIDGAVGREFRVITMQNSMIYPASIACEVGVEYFDNETQETVQDFTKTNFNALLDNEEDD